MAHLTQGSVEGLLGILTSAIKDETRLLRGVKRDIQFIKDEMDSMNGFLLHLTRMETEHTDQHRAWMKQIREVSYLAQDCINLYRRDGSQPGTRFWRWAYILHLPKLLKTWKTRHNLANKLHELKDRVREVGERRLRYGVSVPDAKPRPEPVVKDINADEKREGFLRALEKAELGHSSSASALSSSFKTAISFLSVDDRSEAEVEKILDKCVHLDSKKMLLCALYAYPDVTDLKNKLEGRRVVDVSKEVMLFSYSKLSTQHKSCLQYLTAFLEETRISRKILIRRWVAEGLVARDEGLETMEMAGEQCFDELVFRGFVRPATSVVPGLKIKSCYMEKSVREFVIDISQSENFVAGDLPRHLNYQREIRKFAQQSTTAASPPQRQSPWRICPRKPLQDGSAGARRHSIVAEHKQHPMDKMVHLLETLPEMYRLNVLDLGGCGGLTNRHLKSICKVLSLKYLSLRRTDVSLLPKEINNLWQLETLDVWQTRIDTLHMINLPMLKHLLAGHIRHCPAGNNETDELLLTVQMPNKIAGPSMEILRHVQISGKADLEQVERLEQLRELGVVLNGSKDVIRHLFKTITMLSECLLSLSIWIKPPSSKAGDIILEGTHTDAPPKNLESLNIKYFGESSSSGSLPFPRWIKGLDQLYKITLRDIQVTRESLRTLGKLKSLCCLRLHGNSYTEDCINMGKGEFQKLRFLLVDLVTPNIKFSFEVGAAPKLEKITWTLYGETKITAADTFNGIRNLLGLKELELHGDSSLWFHQLDNLREPLAAQDILLRCSFPEGFFGCNRGYEVSFEQ